MVLRVGRAEGSVSVLRNLSTPKSRAYWEHVDKVAAEVKLAEKLCGDQVFSSNCFYLLHRHRGQVALLEELIAEGHSWTVAALERRLKILREVEQ